VGVHYRVGKKIGEGSFGVIFEGNFFFEILAFFNNIVSAIFFNVFSPELGCPYMENLYYSK
jgi:hypothetical protein